MSLDEIRKSLDESIKAIDEVTTQIIQVFGYSMQTDFLGIEIEKLVKLRDSL